MRWLVALIISTSLALGGSVSNKLVNPGFENDFTGWTVGSGSPEVSSVARYGLKSALFEGNPVIADALIQTLPDTTVAGETVYFGGWLRLASGSETLIELRLLYDSGEARYIRVSTAGIQHIDPTAGILVTIPIEDSSEWFPVRFHDTPTTSGQQVDLLINTSGDEPHGFWYVDSTWVGNTAMPLIEGELITQQIKNAIVGDLNDINGAGIFVTTIGEVGVEPKRFDEAETFAAFIISSDWADDPETLGTIKQKTVHGYTIQLLVKTTTANTDMDKLLDDVRNALQRPTSAILAVAESAGDNANVLDVTLNGTHVFTDPTISEDHALSEVDVSVTYYGTRGSL